MFTLRFKYSREKCVPHGNHRYPFPSPTAHHLSTQIILYVSSTHVKHVFPTEITESVRDKKLQNTQPRLSPTCSFCTHPPRPLFIGGMEQWVSSRRMGKKTHLKAHLSLMVLSRFGRRKMREKIICHLGGLLISMERNSVAALAQDNRPLVLP